MASGCWSGSPPSRRRRAPDGGWPRAARKALACRRRGRSPRPRGRRAREAAAGGTAPGWLSTAAPVALTAEWVAEAARRGDALAMKIWCEAMDDLGAGIATVVNLFNPEVVVIGGGVSGSSDLLLP